jgi:hypothetical protein
MQKVKETPFVRRFWSNLEKAKMAAHLLYGSCENNDKVFVTVSSYGLFGTILYEYSLRLKSEGQRSDSHSIVYSVENTNKIS